MADFSTVVYTITNIKVARLNPTTEVYDAVSYPLNLGSEMSFTFTADNDQIKSYGKIAALLSIVTGVEGTLSQAIIDPPVLQILTGTDFESSGSTPNRVRDAKIRAGGAGLPYFGAIGSFATEDGGNVWFGLAKCKLDAWPAWTVEQNKYRIAETAFKGASIAALDMVGKLRSNETAASILADFNGFFI